jgi:hypothetical protein
VPLPPIDPRSLSIFVFGPGVGELVCVHAPPGEWIVVDGCSAHGRGYARQVIEHYQACVRLIVLTHPHTDHARGVAEVVDVATRGPKAKWPKLGMVPPPVTEGAGEVRDPQAHFEGGVAEQAVAAIVDRWERCPTCRWDMRPGTTFEVGEVEVTALSPDNATRRKAQEKLQKGQGLDWNQMASALLLEWEGRRVLLGSDLVEKPGRGWTEVMDRSGQAAQHGMFKVPHHGSRAALHGPLLRAASRQAEAPVWVVTPFASQNLPRFDDKGGVAFLQRYVDVVHLTGLPTGYRKQGGQPQRIRRRDLARSTGAWRSSPPPPGFPDCYVQVTFSAGAAAPEIRYGAGSVRVT